MKIKNQLTLERLIGKIDNDFNITEADWVGRVAAWTIDCLSQLKCLPMELKRRELLVNNRIAKFPVKLNATYIRVYDKNGIEIRPAKPGTPFNNSEYRNPSGNDYSEIGVFIDDNKQGINTTKIARIVSNDTSRNFVVSGNGLDLNFETDKIYVDTYEVATYHDDYYDTDCPYIYDDGYLLEALSYYVLLKYLSRGSKHQVFDLRSNSPVTNPALKFELLRPKAIASVKIKLANDSGWNNFFYNSTFRPRD